MRLLIIALVVAMGLHRQDYFLGSNVEQTADHNFFQAHVANTQLHPPAYKPVSLALPRSGRGWRVDQRLAVINLSSRFFSNGWLRGTLRHVIKTSRVVLLVVGCLHAKANVSGEFVPKKEHWKSARGFSIPSPKAKAVVIFLHGSFIEKMDDACDPGGEVAGFSVPEVIRQLAGTKVAGLEVLVFAPCDGQATSVGEPIKIDQRVAAIEHTLIELDRAGIDRSRIVLMGHSAGGWAALLHQKRHPGSVNSVIAFAPAFAGKRQGRPEEWQRRHETQASEIGSAEHIPALVYAFDNDAYNTPDDLSFLSRVTGTRLLRLPDKAIGGVACEIPFFSSSHSHAYRKCFSETQADVLLDFLRQQLQREGRVAPVSGDGIEIPVAKGPG